MSKRLWSILHSILYWIKCVVIPTPKYIIARQRMTRSAADALPNRAQEAINAGHLSENAQSNWNVPEAFIPEIWQDEILRTLQQRSVLANAVHNDRVDVENRIVTSTGTSSPVYGLNVPHLVRMDVIYGENQLRSDWQVRVQPDMVILDEINENEGLKQEHKIVVSEEEELTADIIQSSMVSIPRKLVIIKKV